MMGETDRSPVYSLSLAKPEFQFSLFQCCQTSDSSKMEKGLNTADRLEKTKSVFHRIVERQCFARNDRAVKTLYTVLVGGLVWSTLYFTVKGDVLPSGDLFKMLCLAASSCLAAKAAALLRVPPLLGMLFTGVVFNHAGLFRLAGTYKALTVPVRDLALGVILIKAGLSLEARVLKKLSSTILKLAFYPCIAESISAATAAHFVLGLPTRWSLLLGCSMSPVSSASLVPALLSLKSEGFGEDKGISTLIIAASSIDDIVSVSFLGISLSIMLTEGRLRNILYGPAELFLGVTVGVVFGLITAVIPRTDDVNFVVKRAIVIGVGGACATLGGRHFGFPTMSPIFCITESFISAYATKYQNVRASRGEIKAIYAKLMVVASPIYFALMGTEIDFSELRIQRFSSGLVIVASCLLIRVIISFMALTDSNLNWKEKVFVNLVWLPKATVQIALSPPALDLLKKSEDPEILHTMMTRMLLTISVMAVIAPLGCVGFTLGAPYLLRKSSSPEGSRPPLYLDTEKSQRF